MNMELLKSEVSKAIQHPMVFVTVGPLVVLYTMNFVLKDAESVLSLITANTLITNTYVWNIVTSCFYEQNLLKLLVDIAYAAWISTAVEIPNSEQFGLFFLFSVLGCTVFSSIYCFFSLLTTGKEDMLVTPIYGFSGVIVSLLMLARQQQKSKPLYPGVPYLTYHHSPVIMVVSQISTSMLGFKIFTRDLPFALVALLFSWSYLRFAYKFTEFEFGDKSDEFSFVNMFPVQLHIVLVPFTTAFYNVVALLGIFPVLDVKEERRHLPHHLRFSDSSTGGSASSSSASASAAANSSFTAESPRRAAASAEELVAERRRAKALRLLDAKMAEISIGESEGWGDDGGEDLASAIYGNDLEMGVAIGKGGTALSSSSELIKLKI